LWALGFLETRHLRHKLKLYSELQSCVHHWQLSPTTGIAAAAATAAKSLAEARAASEFVVTASPEQPIYTIHN
jgi:hypothetical protein